MLYSYKNKYPKSLPHRIRLSNGTTKTDSSTFTAEEIADAGYVAVEPKPIVQYPEYVTWNGTDWIVNQLSFEEVKSKLMKDLASYRYEQEISHPFIDTTRESQAMINAVWTAYQIDPTLTVNFKNKDGSWTQLNAELISYVSNQVIAHVQSCFNNEKTIADLINLCTTVEELIAVDIAQGWPNYDII
jgi:hypothetical protein